MVLISFEVLRLLLPGVRPDELPDITKKLGRRGVPRYHVENVSCISVEFDLYVLANFPHLVDVREVPVS